jgi:small multidrug resistance pump
MEWLYLSISIIAEVIATSALKASDSFSHVVPTAIVIAGYGTAFFFLTLILNRIPLGVAYAVWSGAGIVLVSIVGAVRFGEIPDTAAMAGIALIICGVVVINVFSKTVSH